MRVKHSTGKLNIYSSKIVLIFFLLVIVRLSFSFVMSSDIFSLTYAVALGLFAIIACVFANKKYRVLMVKREYAYISICLAYIVIAHLITNYKVYKEHSAADIKATIFLFVVCGLYLYMEYFCDTRRKKILLSLYMLGIISSMVATIYVEIKFGGDVIRNSAFAGIQSEEYGVNYGGYGFIYASLIIYMIILTALKENYAKTTLLNKITAFVFLALNATMLVLSNYTTVFFLLILATLYCLLPDDFRKYVVIGLIAILFLFYVDAIVNLVNKISFLSDLTKARINSFLMGLSEQETSEQYLSGEGQRFDRIIWTWEVIKKYPLFGMYAHNTSLLIGNHTQWIDDAGRYGLLYIIVYFFFWRRLYKTIFEKIKEDGRNTNIIKNAYALFFVLGFLDPIAMPVMCGTLLICAPFAEYLFTDIRTGIAGGDK